MNDPVLPTDTCHLQELHSQSPTETEPSWQSSAPGHISLTEGKLMTCMRQPEAPRRGCGGSSARASLHSPAAWTSAARNHRPHPSARMRAAASGLPRSLPWPAGTFRPGRWPAPAYTCARRENGKEQMLMAGLAEGHQEAWHGSAAWGERHAGW